MEYPIENYPYVIEEEKIISIHKIAGNPIPQSRPRVTRNGGVFVSKRNQAYKELLRTKMKIEATDKNRSEFNSTFGIRVFFFRETKQRCDIDNLLKVVQDSGTGILWKDDNQIHEVFGRMFYDKANPRIEVLLYQTEIVGQVASQLFF